jgi:hypothetical protein
MGRIISRYLRIINLAHMVRRYTAALGSSCALHVLAVLIAVWRPPPVPAPASGRRPGALTVVALPPTEDATFPGLNPVERSNRAWAFPPDHESPPLRLGDLRIDVGKIGGRASVLFPFLTPGLSLEHYFPVPRPSAVSSLQNPLARAQDPRDAARNQPLELSEPALQSLVDRAWTRRDRWAAFEPIGRLAETHHPDIGRLPTVLQRYTDQNALQPYADVTARDPRLWAQLGLAADHVDFIGFIRRYASAHPSTRATTELLFLLDRIAEASRDALDVLLDSDPQTRLTWTHTANAKAYRLLTWIRQFYQRELSRRGLRSEEAITAYYDDTRLQILKGIVRTTPAGYRANDARFLIGAICWRQQRTADALRSWREMTPDAMDGRIAGASEVAAALRRRALPAGTGDGASVDPLLRRDIDQILKNEHNRWVAFSYDRLRRFGYRFDSF